MHRRFPDRAFVDLAVAHDDEHTAVTFLGADRKRHPQSHRKPVAQSAGRSLDPGDLAGLRMPAKNGVAMAESIEGVWAYEALVREHHVERQAPVTFAQDHAVAVRPFRFRRPKAQHIVVQDAQDLDQGHGRTDVASPAPVKCAHHLAAQFFGPLVQNGSDGCGPRRRFDQTSHLPSLLFVPRARARVKAGVFLLAPMVPLRQPRPAAANDWARTH